MSAANDYSPSAYAVGQVFDHKGFQVRVFAIGEVMPGVLGHYRMIGIEYLNGIRSSIMEEAVVKPPREIIPPNSVVCVPAHKYRLVDFLRPDGLTEFGKRTLEQVRAEEPGAEVLSYDDAIRLQEAAWTTLAEPITREKFIEMLEVLPPFGWVGHESGNEESFALGEFLIGSVARHYVRIGDEYWTFDAPFMSAHWKRAKYVEETRPKTPAELQAEEMDDLEDGHGWRAENARWRAEMADPELP